ncbi:hypothetical protein HDG34_003257 [Paraburkholderia sp. HC6.4b]|uniref:hypothetical protein n=1 Tax=unclassified Paraburkholderia TaxID=2615204 RepID=UPI0016077913|nr:MULTISPECIES: hypothetical protein [unclassified Paraburkholderia]MBB5409316.1 hypothetical protein [Paraburkholderia sp. HC6.4b]MBB5451044.1 hypothetical protein [Paraburkholderia sp. Kb1A]
MILFLDDFRQYPQAIIDTDTSNQSFLRLATIYRRMSVHNNAFLLALINPDLQGVDPFSADLTLEQMAAIALECKSNPFYFFREVCRIPVSGTNEAVPFQANRGNIALIWCFFNHLMIFLMMIRQTGKSVAVDSLMVLLLNFICVNTELNLLTKDEVLRRTNVDRVKKIIDELPPYLQQRTRQDTHNGEEITINRLGNKYKTHVPQGSEKGAYKVGRGLTTPVIQIDEGPFQPNVSIAVPSALAARNAAVDAARANGSPYGVIFTNTAGKIDDRDGAFIYRMQGSAAPWTEKFYDAENAEELERLVRKSSHGEKTPDGSRRSVYRVNITFNHRQLGKTDGWLREKIEEAAVTGDDANRDFFNMWTSGTQTHPLRREILELIVRSRQEPKHMEISREGYITRWYVQEREIEARMRLGRFVIGLDPSNASGGDDISLVALDIDTLEVIAAGTYNETNILLFCGWVAQWLIRWDTTTLVIENRSLGQALIDYLLYMLPGHGIDPFRRLFNRIVQEYDELPARYHEIQVPMGRRPTDIYTRYKKAFGFTTSGGGTYARSELYSASLQLAAKRAGSNAHDPVLIQQVAHLTTRNGRIDHEEGLHDDMVIGWLLAHWLLTRGKMLSFYGIDDRRIGSALNAGGQETMIDHQRRREQQAIQDEIGRLADELSREPNEWVAARIEHQMRLLDRRIVLEEGEIFSMDTLINQAKEKKRERRLLRRAATPADPPNPSPLGFFSDTPPGANIHTLKRGGW